MSNKDKTKQEGNQVNEGKVAEQPSTETATQGAQGQQTELVKVEAPPVPEVPVQRTAFNLDLFANNPLMALEHTTHTTKDGKKVIDGDRFKLMTRKDAATVLKVENNKDNRQYLDKTIIDEGMVAWRKVKSFLMSLPDEWILKRFVMKKKVNGRTNISLNIEDLEQQIIELEKVAKAYGVKVEDLAEFLESKKAKAAKPAQTEKPANVVVN